MQVRNVGKTLVTRSSGMRVATEFLKGRIVEANLADLNKDEDQNYRKMKLQILVSLSLSTLCPRPSLPPASRAAYEITPLSPRHGIIPLSHSRT
jgi:hypothetical protein